MRKDIEIELVHDAHNDKITAFNVYYSARDPHLAQKVTSELTNLFINENVEVRQQLSEDTTQFLQNQLETARNALAEQEEKIRVFKGQHVGEMPAQQQSNLAILSGLQSQLQNAEDALNTAKQQRIYLQTLVDQYRSLQGTVSSGGGAPESLPAIDKELERLKTQLADLSSRYTDKHPDLRKLKEQIARTEKTRDALIADLAAKSASAPADDNAKNRSASDLAPNSPMMQLQGQLHANQVEIASRERAIAELKASLGGYQARLNQEPVREQQLADLTRGYDQSKANYDDLLKKKNESEMATSMERLQQGERFRVLDPPGLPSKPDFPNRLKFCGMGLGVGLMLGLVVAGGFELMDDRMHSEKEIKDYATGRRHGGDPRSIEFLGPREEETESLAGMGYGGSCGCDNPGRVCLQLFARVVFRHVQELLQSNAESVRTHARSGIPVLNQAPQRGACCSVLRSEAA